MAELGLGCQYNASFGGVVIMIVVDMSTDCGSNGLRLSPSVTIVSFGKTLIHTCIWQELIT